MCLLNLKRTDYDAILISFQPNVVVRRHLIFKTRNTARFARQNCQRMQYQRSPTSG